MIYVSLTCILWEWESETHVHRTTPDAIFLHLCVSITLKGLLLVVDYWHFGWQMQIWWDGPKESYFVHLSLSVKTNEILHCCNILAIWLLSFHTFLRSCLVQESTKPIFLMFIILWRGGYNQWGLSLIAQPCTLFIERTVGQILSKARIEY